MKRKLPEPLQKEGKFICPDCNKEFPSKPSYNMHWYHAHTDAFKNKNKRKKRRKKILVKEEIVIPTNNTPQSLLINYCPSCGLSLNPINMALNLMKKYD